MDEKVQDALKLQFDKRLRLEIHRARITSGAGLLTCRELDGARRFTGVIKGLETHGAGYYYHRCSRQVGLGTALPRVDMGNPG